MTKKYTVGAFALSAFTLAFNQAVYAQEDAALEEVVVTGIRASLEAAVDAKRNDGRIVDSVVAEDIGKLPDNNIAEALQRVTGVSINRDFGVGSDVSIRGLPQNRVEINGRSSVGDGRSGVSFDDFPASFLQAVEVVKSPTPEMIEGALGGTISLKTARPLDLKDRVIAVSLDAEYADKADNWAPIFSGSFGNNWDFGDAGSFGVMASVAYQDRWLRQDTASASIFPSDKWSNGVIGLEDTPAENTPSGLYLVPDEHKFEPFTEQRTRTAYNVSMQWAPASELGSFYVDLNSTERDGGQEAYSILSVIGAPTASASTTEDGAGQLNNYVLADSLPIPKTWSSFRFTESYSNAIGGEWNFTDKLKVSGEYAIAESDTMTLASELNLRAVDPVAEAANPADANQWYTDVTIINSQDQMPTVDYADDGAYTDASHLALREYRHRELPVQNKETAMRLDLEYSEPFGLEWFTAIKTGMRFTDRSYEKGESEVRVKDIYKNLTTDGDPDIVWLSELDNVETLVFDDAFEHSGIQGVNDLTSFTVYDAAALRNVGQTYDMIQGLLAGTNLALEGSLDDNLAETKGSYSYIEEDTSAFYLQANLDFDHAHIIVGGRYVKSEITSTAYNQEGDAFVSDGNTYSDFLPSLNVTVDLTEDTLLRFGGAKVMSRPNFSELSPTFVFNSDKVTATRGNPQLNPYRATQFDMALEHYFGTGNMVSFTVFYKDVDSFLSETTYCAYDADAIATQNTTIYDNICLRDDATSDKDSLVFASSQEAFNAALAAGRNGVRTTIDDNGESGNVRGYEIGYQQAFDFLPGAWSGLGVNANYTSAASEQPGGVPLEDISENTYNAQVYWEHEGFAVRLAYTYRDKFLDTITHKRVERVGELVLPADIRTTDNDPTLGNDYRDGLSQLDLSASWDVTDSITLIANASNLTGEPTINQAATGTTFQLQESDRRFSFGVRAKF